MISFQLHGVTNSALKALERLMKNLMHGSLSKFLDDIACTIYLLRNPVDKI